MYCFHIEEWGGVDDLGKIKIGYQRAGRFGHFFWILITCD